MDALERVIRPIVEGQIRSFVSDHPEVIEAVNWYKRRPDKRITFVNSLAKRIVRDLLCDNSRARLAAALVEASYCENSENAEPGTTAGAATGGVGLTTAPPVFEKSDLSFKMGPDEAPVELGTADADEGEAGRLQLGSLGDGVEPVAAPSSVHELARLSELMGVRGGTPSAPSTSKSTS